MATVPNLQRIKPAQQNPQNNPGWFGNFRTRARDMFMGARQRIGATANAIEAKVVKEKV